MSDTYTKNSYPWYNKQVYKNLFKSKIIIPPLAKFPLIIARDEPTATSKNTYKNYFGMNIVSELKYL